MNNDITNSCKENLINAVKKGDLAFLSQHLSLHPEEVNTSNSFNENLLFIASSHGHIEMVKLLLSHGADIHQLNTGKHTMIFGACMNGHLLVFQELIRAGVGPRELYGSDPNKLSESETKPSLPINLAMKYGHIDIVKYCLEQLMVEEDYQYIRWNFSGAARQTAKIFDLISQTKIASDINHLLGIVKGCLHNPNTHSLALVLNRFPMIQDNLFLLFEDLKHTFVSNSDKTIPLKKSNNPLVKKYQSQIFIQNLKSKSAKFLIPKYLPFETQDKSGNTLLHCAAQWQSDEYEDVSLIKALLGLGYPIDIQNTRQQTPLHIAISSGMFYHALFLIMEGANVMAVDQMGLKAIDYAETFCALGLTPFDVYNIELKRDLIEFLKTRL